MRRENSDQSERKSTLALLCIFGGCVWLALWSGQPLKNNIFIFWPSVAWVLVFFASLNLLTRFLEHGLFVLDWLSSRQPTGKSGTASWANYKDYRKDLIHHRKSSCFWGVAATGKRAALFFDFVSNAMCVAPAGSGKGIYTVITNAIAILASKVFVDFKGELVCMLKDLLEKRGEAVHILNPCGIFQDRLGKSASLNPFDIVADDFTRQDGLRDVMDDLHEINMQLYPEPKGGDDDNKYFRDGARDLMEFAMLIECMINGYDATLSAVALLIKDRIALEDHARWVAGVDVDGNPHKDGAFPVEQCDWAKNHSQYDLAEFTALLRANANSIIKLAESTENNAFNSFITGAQQALKPFAFGRLSPALGRSTFDVNDLKHKKKRMSIFIVADASRIELSDKFIGIVTRTILTAMKRHPNKHIPVYFILDEVTNYFIKGLETLLTWGRGYGVRLFLIFQTLSAFVQKYGDHALETLLSETEIKQFLSGQRSPKTLKRIKELLGDQSVMTTSLSRSAGKAGLQENQSEMPRPLMTEDEIRRTQNGIVLVRDLPPIICEPVSYAEIHPWRKQVKPNPFHKKPLRKRLKLRL